MAPFRPIWKVLLLVTMVNEYVMAEPTSEQQTSSADVSSECPPTCRCSLVDRDYRHYIKVVCSEETTALPEHLPPKVTNSTWFYDEYELHLNHTQVTNLSNAYYMHNTSLLFLSSSRLVSVDGDALYALTRRPAYDVTLDNNQLRYLPRAVQTMLFDTLTLHDNPWVCDCHTRWFLRWLKLASTGYSVVNLADVRCGSPYWVKGRTIVGMTPDEFVCTDPWLRRLEYIVFAVLFAVTCIGLVALVYVMVKRYRRHQRVSYMKNDPRTPLLAPTAIQ